MKIHFWCTYCSAIDQDGEHDRGIEAEVEFCENCKDSIYVCRLCLGKAHSRHYDEYHQSVNIF